MTLNDPGLVAAEYASECGLLTRRSIYDDAIYEDGRGPLEITFSEVAQLDPQRL